MNTSFSWGGPKIENEKKKKDKKKKDKKKDKKKKKKENIFHCLKTFNPLDYISLESINLKIPK